MLFLLRCVLWLSIVYAAILFPQGHAPRPAAFAVAPTPHPDLAQTAAATITTAVGTFCKTRAAQCLDDAARLTSLIAATDSGGHAAGTAGGHAAGSDRPRRDPIATILRRAP